MKANEKKKEKIDLDKVVIQLRKVANELDEATTALTVFDNRVEQERRLLKQRVSLLQNQVIALLSMFPDPASK